MASVFFDTTHSDIIDEVMPDGRGRYGGRTLTEYQAEYRGEVIIISSDEAVERHKAKFMKPVRQVTKERFWDMLEVLPPCRWWRESAAESFFVSERITYDLVSWFVRLGDKYYELVASDKLNHHDVVALVLASED